MKITAVRTHVLEARLSQPFAYSRAWYATRTAMIVEVATDDGLIGWGECYGPARMTAAVVAEHRALADRRGSARTDVLWREIYARLRDHGQKGVVIQGLSGIDIALWDIKGKRFGVPVHRLTRRAACAPRCRPTRPGFTAARSGDPLTLSGRGGGRLRRRRVSGR